MYYYELQRLRTNVSTMAKYTSGLDITPPHELNDQVVGGELIGSGYGIFKLGQGAYWLGKNRKDIPGAWKTFRNDCRVKNATARQMKGKNIFQTLKNIDRNTKINKISANIPKEMKNLSAAEYAKLSETDKLKYNNKLILSKQKEQVYKRIKDMITHAKGLRGKDQKLALKQIQIEMSNAKLDVFNIKMLRDNKMLAKAVKSTRMQRAMAGFRKFSGYNAAKGFKLKAEAGKFGKAFKVLKYTKGAKGNIIFAGIQLAMDYNDIDYAFKHGKGKEQLAYSAGSFITSMAGYAAGAAASASLGAEIGTAVGTICPGPGNIVGGIAGAAVGFVCGCIGGMIADKAYQGIVGKSPADKLKENEASQKASNAMTSSVSAVNLLNECEQKIKNEGTDDEETKMALDAYNAVLDELQNQG